MLGNINSETMRATNLQVIFDYIRRNEPASRRDIAEFGGLTVAAVSNITSKLLANGLVVEVGAGESVGGRRPTLLGINADCRYAVGIDLTTKQIKLVITNFKAQIIQECACETPLDCGPEHVLDSMARMVKESVKSAGIDPQKVIGIGIVSAGPCDPERGIMQSPPNFPDWGNVPIRDYIQEHTGYPAIFDKDSVGAAMAEYWFGKVGGCGSAFGFLINRAGVGGALLVDGEVFRGFNGGAGEVGHTIVDVHGAKCSCGNYGCLETLVNEQRLVREVATGLKMGRESVLDGIEDYDSITLKQIMQAAEDGDILCRNALDRMADYLAIGIRNIATLFSPEMIVLSGGMISRYAYFTQTVLKNAKQRQREKFVKCMNVVECSFRENQCALGAVALVLEKFYRSIQLD